MKKERTGLKSKNSDVSADAISVDLSDLVDSAAGKPHDDPSAHKIQVEFAMKVKGTRTVSYTPACAGEPPPVLELSMFPGSVSGQVLMEGEVICALAGTYGPHDTSALMTDDGEVFPDDLLFRGFMDRRVQVIKTAEGFLVRKV